LTFSKKETKRNSRVFYHQKIKQKKESRLKDYFLKTRS
jgi:hypothetical protein